MTGQSIILRTVANLIFAVKIVGNLKIDPEHPLEIVIRQHRKKRSLDQNALYWSWLGIIGRERGIDSDDLHEIFKHKFAEAHVATAFGETIEVSSTAKMNTAQMSEYLDRVFIFAASEGIILPQPEERWAA